MKKPRASGGLLLPRCSVAVFRIGVFPPKELIAHQGDYRQRQEQRDENGDSERDRQGGKELPNDSLQQAQREEYDDRRESGGRHRPDQLVDSIPYRLVAKGIESQVTND